MSRKYDILLFGVTGTTGRFSASHLVSQLPRLKFSLAFCGRSKERQEEIRDDLLRQHNVKAGIDVLTADHGSVEELRVIRL